MMLRFADMDSNCRVFLSSFTNSRREYTKTVLIT